MTGTRTTRHNPSIATLAANPFIGTANNHKPPGFIDLSVCRFGPPAIVTDALANAADLLLPVIGNGHHTPGLPVLRETLAQAITTMGMPTLPSQLLITTGSQQALALHHVPEKLERNDRVMIKDPHLLGRHPRLPRPESEAPSLSPSTTSNGPARSPPVNVASI